MYSVLAYGYGGYGGYYGGYRGGGVFSYIWPFIVGGILALAATILLYVLVFPKRKEGRLPGFFAFLRNFFDVRYLIIEKIAKFIYVLNTMSFIFVGFFLLFGRTFLIGLLCLVLGPIVCRITYELFMLTILLVKNVMEINGKIKGDNSGSSQFDASFADIAKQQPAAPQAPAMTRCPHCGAEVDGESVFCYVCGNKIK